MLQSRPLRYLLFNYFFNKTKNNFIKKKKVNNTASFIFLFIASIFSKSYLNL